MKKLELIGCPLGHSWSPQIHKLLIGAEYSLHELKEEDLDAYMRAKDFDGINVTIPYKQKVIPYLDEIDPAAKKIGAINCIVNDHGILKGYNTDWIGFSKMTENAGIDVKGKRCAVLGSGGASKAVCAALEAMGASYDIISRTKSAYTRTYEELYVSAQDYRILVNATPVGMAPHTKESPVNLEPFTNLEAVIDVIANPLRTHLLYDAKCRGLKTLGGFEMLVRQAAAADLFFTGEEPSEETIQACMAKLRNERTNIVLVGMPTSGKTTFAQMLSEVTKRAYVEMDDEIVRRMGIDIPTCFKEKGEAYFRRMECETAKDNAQGTGKIISCGGGVIKTPGTMRYLAENGTIVWLQRDLALLYASDSRPLSKDVTALKQLYRERLPLYRMYSDVQVNNNGTIEETLKQLIAVAEGVQP